ncbi:copper chaperone PCu(A)C [Actinoplanes sp. NPDC048967]|uniref:copper chaperone PCu(A)C n=1 Tax=Actinoplanes sp. NPDC048967 TaxID=3155269 RepID=UPI0033EDB9BC
MSNPLNRGSRRTLAAALLAGALTTLGLTGCGGSDAAGGTPVPAAAPSASASTGLVVKDPWVKAAKAGTMTAAFAILVNDSATDITVVSAESPASPMELHEMTMQDGKMLMRPKQGGFVIKARSTHELGPGGDHLMLMKPAAAIDAGNEVTFTLKLADGRTVPFTAIAKPFAGAGESYDPGMSMPASGMPMAPMGSAAP